MVLIHTKYNEGTTKSIESSLCNYSDTYVLVTGNVTVEWADNNKTVAFKNSAPFRKCRTEINDAFIDDAEHINITMPVYNLIEYSGNFSNTSESLWQFKSDEIEGNVNLKSTLIKNRNGVKIAVPLKYLSNFWRSLEMSLINCKVKFSWTWDPTVFCLI